ncbi:amino acid adenylation domain-containing protein [Virgibacillus sp. NKC19-3]|uniref:non-ribosomal peptide synthetase n=1 Tax=Virgibacillus saliphilus TaxID=2831674 RepID=UPI001C9AB85C|nr:non-ribosomal peptide synthetase [Virgibacillus sp. NKC19-3]MBY7142457.1 amino acid adenylation domain-containing protein [Virgibacillus sp. NKC19-3]
MNNLNKKISTLTEAQKKLLSLKMKRRNETEQRKIVDNIPLSTNQNKFWIFNQQESNNPIYNMVSAVKIKGDLDSDVLKKSLEVIIQRHEILRTRFNLENGKPQQEVMSSIKAPFQIIKIDKQTKNIQQLLKKYGRRSFNLTADGPLFEVTLIRQAEFEHILVLTMHHIISDGWSMGILVREWITVYQSMLKKESHLLPDLDFQYKDYVNWQLEKTQIEAVQKDLVYWEGQLKNAPPLLELSTDYPRKPVMSYKGSIEYFEVPGKLTKQLKQLARESDATLYMVLLGTFKVLLHRYSGQDDILVGSPVSGRTKYETENLIGLFINTLVLRTNMKDNPRFVDFLEQVSGTMLEAFAHQNAPFDKVVEVTKPERSSSYGPLIQSLFTFHNEPRTEIEVADLGISPMNVDIGYTQFDVSLTIQEGFNGELLGAFEYSTDLFKPETIQRMVKHYCNLLQSIVKNPMKRIGELTLLSKKEEERLIVDWNNTEEPFPEKTCIHELIEEQVKSTPLNTAVIYENEELTYKELNERANQLGHYLRKSGVTRGQAVGIYLNRSPEMLISIFGILKAGGCFVPLDPSYPKERIAYMIEDAKVEVIVTNQKEATYLNGVNIISLQEEVSNITEQSIDNLSKINTSSDVAYIIYTSGSTGKPKGVAIKIRSLVNLLYAFKNFLPIQTNDNLLAITSLSFDISLLELLYPLISKSTVVIATDDEITDGRLLLKKIIKNNITIMQATPSAWGNIINCGWEPDIKIEKIISGGEELKEDLAKVLKLRSKELYNMYGPTETTIWSFKSKISSIKNINIGRPLINTKAYIFDKYLQPVPIGVVGELYIGGAGLSSGYINNKEKTNSHFLYHRKIKDWIYKSGDMVRYTEKGDIEYIGRKDHLVKVRGFRIDLNEVENVLMSHSCVKLAIVYVKDNRLIANLHLLKKITVEEISEYISNKLPKYLQPSLYMRVDSIPLTKNGKVNRDKVKQCNVRLESNKEAKKRLSDVESSLLRLWENLLQIEIHSAYSNFYELGGHSLLVTQLFNDIQRIFNVDLPIKSIIEYPSIHELSKRILEKKVNQNKGISDKYPSVEINEPENFMPFPITEIQQAYWVGKNLKTGLSKLSTHLYQELDFKNLNLSRFEEVVNIIINRHPMLRAIIKQDGQQQILENVPFYKIQSENLQENNQKNIYLKKIRAEMSHQVFDSNNWPMFNIKASHFEDRKTRIHISIDLLIADARSINIMINEILNLYKDPNYTLNNLELTFRDYILTEKKIKQTRIYEKSKKYWLDRLCTFPDKPKLPVVKSKQGNSIFSRKKEIINGELWKSLKESAKQKMISINSLLLAAFTEIIGLWSENKHFAVNLTTFNRLPLHDQVNSIVGDFTSINLLEVNLNKGELFENRVKKIQNQLLEDLEYRYFSGIEFIRELRKYKKNNEIYPIVFTSLIGQEYESIPKEKVEIVDNFSITQTSQVWLDCQITETENSLCINWDYLENIFPEGLIDKMFSSYIALIKSISLYKDIWTSK